MHTISEQLFEDYLNGRKIGFDREKGSVVHPDYWLRIPAQPICEVKEIDPPQQSVTYVTTTDPYKKLRKAFKKKVRQGEEAKSQNKPYIIVLYNRSFAVDTRRPIIEGAMYGNISFVFNIYNDPKRRAEHVGNFFVDKGSMRYARDLHDKGILVKTRVSAIAILEQYRPTQRILDQESKKAILGIPISSFNERYRILMEIEKKLRKEGKYNDEIVPRVRVFHNFFAEVPLGFDVFSGQYDKQYYIDPKTGASMKYEDT